MMNCASERNTFFSAMCGESRKDDNGAPWSIHLKLVTLRVQYPDLPPVLNYNATLLDVAALITWACRGPTGGRLNANAFAIKWGTRDIAFDEWATWSLREIFRRRAAVVLQLKENSPDMYCDTVMNPCETCAFCKNGKVCADVAFSVADSPGIVRLEHVDAYSVTMKHTEATLDKKFITYQKI